jgi:RND family efflux transporter MFP subunit
MPGSVEAVSLSANDETGLFEADVLIHNVDFLLKPGTIVSVEILVYETDSALVVPRESVVDEGDASYLYIIGTGNTAEKRKVIVGEESEGEVEILDGVDTGMSVVVRGHNKLQGGERVYIHRVEDAYETR